MVFTHWAKVTLFTRFSQTQRHRPVLESNHEFNEAPVISNALSMSFRAKREILALGKRFLSRIPSHSFGGRSFEMTNVDLWLLSRMFRKRPRARRGGPYSNRNLENRYRRDAGFARFCYEVVSQIPKNTFLNARAAVFHRGLAEHVRVLSLFSNVSKCCALLAMAGQWPFVMAKNRTRPGYRCSPQSTRDAAMVFAIFFENCYNTLRVALEAALPSQKLSHTRILPCLGKKKKHILADKFWRFFIRTA
jgi:hypothetical protein